MPFVPEEQHGKLVIMAMHLLTPAHAEAGERGAGAVPGARRRRSPTCVRPMPYPEMYPPEDEDYHPTAVARTMFIDAVDRLSRRRSSSASRRRTRRCGSPSSASSAGRWPACRPTRPRSPTARAGSWSTSPRSTTGPDDQAGAAGLGRPTSRRELRQGDPGAYVNFLGDEGEERVRAAYPGATWDRLAASQGAVRPDEPVPAQPEHPARGRLTAARLSRRAPRATRGPGRG